MDKRKSIKTAAAVLTAVALCVSSVAAYQRLGNTYVPSDQKRDLQTNQVLFPEDKDTQNSDSGTQEDESAYWEKDQSADAQGRPQNSQRADYLFEDQQVPDAENQNSLTINKPNTDTDTQPPQQSNAQQTTVQQPEQFQLLQASAIAEIMNPNHINQIIWIFQKLLHGRTKTIFCILKRSSHLT